MLYGKPVVSQIINLKICVNQFSRHKWKKNVTNENHSFFSVFFKKYFPCYFSAKNIFIFKKIFYPALHVIWLGVGSKIYFVYQEGCKKMYWLYYRGRYTSCQVKTKFAAKCNKYLRIIANIKKHKLMRRLLKDVYENISCRIGVNKKIYWIHHLCGVFIMSYRLKNVSTRQMFLKKYFLTRFCDKFPKIFWSDMDFFCLISFNVYKSSPNLSIKYCIGFAFQEK